MRLPYKRGWSQPMKFNKRKVFKDAEKLTTPRAEFLLKFAFMSDEQFWKWSELKTTAEARAFMEAIPMPPMETNDDGARRMYIELEQREGRKK